MNVLWWDNNVPDEPIFSLNLGESAQYTDEIKFCRRKDNISSSRHLLENRNFHEIGSNKISLLLAHYSLPYKGNCQGNGKGKEYKLEW